jgi:hypothetical protein
MSTTSTRTGHLVIELRMGCAAMKRTNERTIGTASLLVGLARRDCCTSRATPLNAAARIKGATRLLTPNTAQVF